MDFELFEWEDDEILSSICISPEAPLDIEINPFPAFNCAGEDSRNSSFALDSFVKNKYLFNPKVEATSLKQLTSYRFTESSLQIDSIFTYLFGQCRMYIQTLFVNSKVAQYIDTDISNYEMRREVTNLLFLLRANLDELHRSKLEKNLKAIRTLLDRMGSVEALRLLSLANSMLGNEAENPSYHFIHGYLEWLLVDLIILDELGPVDVHNPVQEASTSTYSCPPVFETQYQVVIEKLFIMSISLFNQKVFPQYVQSSPFPCTCIKEMWLLMQLLLEKSDPNSDFWEYFSKTVEKLKNNSEQFGLAQKYIYEFIIWLLRGVVKLHGYDANGVFVGIHNARVKPNFVFLENIVNGCLASDISEEKLRAFLCIISTILLEWWPPKTDIPLVLWEYFYKKINSSFYAAGSAPISLAVIRYSGKSYVDEIRRLIKQKEPNLQHTSFSMFLIILGQTTERVIAAGQSNQSQKIFGRVYTKFSSSKILTYNETGIHHFIELFLVLAHTMTLKDIAGRLRDKLLSVPIDQMSSSEQICLIKGHLALMILFIENGINIADYIVQLLEQVKSAKYDLSILRSIAESLLDILNSTTLFVCGEDRLIDSWLLVYLNSAPFVEQERLLQIIHGIFDNIKQNIVMGLQTNKSVENLLKALAHHVLPHVKQNFVSSSSRFIPLLAADFCILLTKSENSYEFQKLFKYFVETNCFNKQSHPKFLLAILNSNKSNIVDADTIIRIWLKSLVLLTADNADVMNLTKLVVNLDDFRIICALQPDELITAKEPLCVFVSAVGKTYTNCENPNKKCIILEKFNNYLTHFEKWVSEKNETPEISVRFYSFIAIVFFNCAQLVYIRSKITCFFHVAMTQFITPPSIQIGKPPDPKLAQMIHKIWHIIVQGIGTLNFKTDPYLTKALTDLIIKWTPHFRISANPNIVAKPFICCVTSDNEALEQFVFEKLAVTFLTTQRRQADINSCLVVTIFQEVFEVIKENGEKLKRFLRTVIFILFEHLIMVDNIVPSRKMIVDLLKSIINSSTYHNNAEIKMILIENLKQLTNKHLSYYTYFFFDVLTLIVNMCPDIVEKLMDHLKEQIKIVEMKRGFTQDASLRASLEKLNGALLNSKTKRSSP